MTIELKGCKEFYPDAEEANPRKKLEPLGEPVTVCVYVYELSLSFIIHTIIGCYQ